MKMLFLRLFPNGIILLVVVEKPLYIRTPLLNTLPNMFVWLWTLSKIRRRIARFLC